MIERKLKLDSKVELNVKSFINEALVKTDVFIQNFATENMVVFRSVARQNVSILIGILRCRPME